MSWHKEPAQLCSCRAGQDNQVAAAEPQQLQHIITHPGIAQRINGGRSDCVTAKLLEWNIHRDGYNQG